MTVSKKIIKTSSVTILGIQEPKSEINLQRLSETDFKLMYYLVKNLILKIDELAYNIEITTKTVKRRLDDH